MEFAELAQYIDPRVFSLFEKKGYTDLRPAQEKSVNAGIFEGKNILVCTPTASGKTFVAELACLQHIITHQRKAIYIVPLKSLAMEKYREFKELYGGICKVALSIGDKDSAEERLAYNDLIVMTSEKLDAILRHRPQWIALTGCLVVDEIHLLNDESRGPTLEIVITMMRTLIPKMQVIGLSATIGNAKDLASWLDAALVEDLWRPIPLKQGIYVDGKITFYK